MLAALTLSGASAALTTQPGALARLSPHSRARPLVAAERAGLLCVGLAGNNGVTLVAGQLANQRGMRWESQRDGPKDADYLGCITQIGALPRRHPELAAFNDVAVGGWDVVPTGLGDALYHARILDYDLVRQLRDEMNEWPVMRGVWDADYYGDTQREGATHVRDDAPTRSAQLEALRADIRRFKSERGVDGHCTVVWSASVERASAEYDSAPPVR